LVKVFVMAISNDDREDVVSAVSIEMDRMFGILAEQFPPGEKEKHALLTEIERDLKDCLRTNDPSGSSIL
jgi:hypothetical protein